MNLIGIAVFLLALIVLLASMGFTRSFVTGLPVIGSIASVVPVAF